MPTLQLIQKNSNTCPVSGGSGVSIPIVLAGAVGVIAIVGIVGMTGNKSSSSSAGEI